MNKVTTKQVLVLGGSGFVGSYLVQALHKQGWQIRVATRHAHRARHLLTIPTVEVVQADVFDTQELAGLMVGMDAVINLVGVLKGGQTNRNMPYGAVFAKAHVELPEKIIATAKVNGLHRVVHMSALCADVNGPSDYLRSKGVGEKAMRHSGLDVTIIRPSVIFGRGDSFLTMFARLVAVAPVVPLACPDAQFQPVYVGDVAAVIANALASDESIGKDYELGGPEIYTLRRLVRYVASLTRHNPLIIGLGPALSMLQAWTMEFVPGGPITRDNVRSMSVASVCKLGLPFGLPTTMLEAIAPTYLMSGI